ncbi:hypothetical protein BGX29_002091 [Mortierella sp. GBA35]|nr:hypothetical protein BGX29_002091 [Mortierella sp. GBA35]
MPELIVMIGQFSDINSRTQLALVNPLLHHHLERIFWSTLDLSKSECAQRLLLSSDSLNVLHRNVDHIRRLKLRTGLLFYLVANATRQLDLPSITEPTTTIARGAALSFPAPHHLPNSLSVALPQMTRLTSLEYVREQTKNGSTVPHSDVSGLSELMWLCTFNKSLTVVHLHGCDIESVPKILMLVQAISGLSSLQDLYLRFQRSAVRWRDVVREIFLRLPVSLECLYLCIDQIMDNGVPLGPQFDAQDQDSMAEGAMQQLVRQSGPLDRLRDLRIYYSSWEEAVLLPEYVRHCPALEVFAPPYWIPREEFRSTLTNLAQAVAMHCSSLRQLDTCGQGTMHILKAVSRHSVDSVRTLGTQFNSDVNSILRSICRRQFNSIRELRLEHCGPIDGAVVQKILRSRSLETLCIHQYFGSAIRLEDLVVERWRCLGLTTLDIAVNLNPRPLPTEQGKIGEAPVMSMAKRIMMFEMLKDQVEEALPRLKVMHIRRVGWVV